MLLSNDYHKSVFELDNIEEEIKNATSGQSEGDIEEK